MTYFHMGDPTLSSALSVFTTEFGMVSGGSHSLWPPGKPVNNLENVILERGMSRSKHPSKAAWVLYGQASRSISTG